MPAILVKPITGVLAGYFLDPPAFTRLEPQSVSGDPTPGIAAAIHDPLWMLLRQWQVGEFAGENAGTPLSLTMTSHSDPIVATMQGDVATIGPLAGTAMPVGGFIDPAVEREPPDPNGPGLRLRAEAGSILIAVLADAGLDAAKILRDAYPFADTDLAGIDRSVTTLVRRSPDAEAVARDLEAGSPEWLSADPRPIDAAKSWLAWYRAGVSPHDGGGSWQQERLEYRFSVATEPGPAQTVFTAPMHLGGEIDWHTFDLRDASTMTAAGARGARESRVHEALASPLRFAGMPANRFWEYEDGAVNFGAMNVQANDPARLCLIEFATIFSCDWFLAPLDVPLASWTTVEPISVIDTFGEVISIPPAKDERRSGRFSLFEVSGSSERLPGLLITPSAHLAMEGEPHETVHFVRDETANIAWAIERTIQDKSGRTRQRSDESHSPPAFHKPATGADTVYVLETDVPKHWIPLVPVPTGETGGYILRKGTMTDTDESKGRILAGTPFDLYDEELPRAGIRVSRTPCLARGIDGTLSRWIAMRIGQSHGGVESGFASDKAELLS